MFVFNLQTREPCCNKSVKTMFVRSPAAPSVPSLHLSNVRSSTAVTPSLQGSRLSGNSHCGLTLSDIPGTDRTNLTLTTCDTVRSTRHQPPPPSPSVRARAESHSEAIISLQRNKPFVRRISQEVLPAQSPDRYSPSDSSR